MAAVGDDGELDASGPAVVEERLDRGADRAARVEDVVDEDAGAALDREVEAGLADERLRVQRRPAAADVDVVAVEGDVERAEVDLDAAELLDQAAEAVRERDAARVDADERDRVEVGVRLDDLVGDAVKGALERICVEELPWQRELGQLSIRSPFRPHWTGLKDGAGHRLAPLEDVIRDVRRIALIAVLAAVRRSPRRAQLRRRWRDRSEPARTSTGSGARPHPRSVVVFMHGLDQSELYPGNHLPWIEHLVRMGNDVIYPRYESAPGRGPALLHSAKAIGRGDGAARRPARPGGDRRLLARRPGSRSSSPPPPGGSTSSPPA